MGDIDLKVGITWSLGDNQTWTQHFSFNHTHGDIQRMYERRRIRSPKKKALEADLLQVIQRYQKLLIVLEDLEDAGRRDILSFSPGEHGYTTGFLFASINVRNDSTMTLEHLRSTSELHLPKNWLVHPFPHISTAENHLKSYLKKPIFGFRLTKCESFRFPALSALCFSLFFFAVPQACYFHYDMGSDMFGAAWRRHDHHL